MFNKIKTFLPIALCCISLVAFANENENTEKQVPQESKGQTITTKAGDTYENCKVKKVNSRSITIFHSNGIVKIPFAQLPQDIQDEYSRQRKVAVKKLLVKKFKQRMKDAKERLGKSFMQIVNNLEPGKTCTFNKAVSIVNVIGSQDMLVKRVWNVTKKHRVSVSSSSGGSSFGKGGNSKILGYSLREQPKQP